MTTLRIRSLVSLAAALTLPLTLGGCASAPSRAVVDAPAPAGESAAVIRFDNGARDFVHVYLVSAKREWLLGRVEPGAHATLRIPADALTEDAGSLQLSVLPGERVTLRTAGMSRAATTIPQPVGAILSQRWTFSQPLAQGQLTSLRLGRAGEEVGRQ
jgi:hypothetical protein